MWILVWVILSGFILGVFGWSYIILSQQKTAWQVFAKRHNLTYMPGRWLESPAVKGAIDGASISLFTAAEPTADARGQRFLTVIEIDMGAGMPLTGAIGTPQLADLLSSLEMNETYTPEGSEWNPAYIVKGRSAEEMKSYLSPERAKIIHSIFSMKNSIGLIFFNETDFAIRIETSDPLRNPDKMDKIVRWLLSAMRQLKA